MSDLLGLCVDIPVTPKLSFNALPHPSNHKNGWGIAWYPEQEVRATAIRDALSGGSSGLTEVLADWDMIHTPLMMAHVRAKTQKAIYRDTHPFIFNFMASSWTIIHTGELLCDLPTAFPLDDDFPIRPLGDSDTEYLFCWLLNQIYTSGATNIEEYGYDRIAQALDQANQHGELSVIIADGRSMVSYSCKTGSSPLYWCRRSPKINEATQTLEDAQIGSGAHYNRPEVTTYNDDGFELSVSSYLSDEYCMVLTSTIQFDDTFELIVPGEMLVTQRGSLVHQTDSTKNAASRLIAPRAIPQGPEHRKLLVSHSTRYSYEIPVEHSSHKFRLAPVIDNFQRVYDYRLSLGVNGLRYNYEDVFGNEVVGLEVDATYNEFVIHMSAIVDVRSTIDQPELLPSGLHLPVTWLPWQAKMMQSYLLPPELPESQLRELTDYARSFSKRNKGHLLPTLEDITWTIYSDYSYKPGLTTLETTAYEVYADRAGVCQDFANLMICLARLLNVPARYRVGYIYTGSNYENTEQSDASHAWVEVYVPMLGWRGYDPTNGSKVGGDHIRVASGRNYLDATPTSGVIYIGGGHEKLEIDVHVSEYEQ